MADPAPHRPAWLAVALIAVVAFGAAGCGGPDGDETATAGTGTDRAALEARGHEIAEALQTRLKAELVEALAEGPTHAIEVCSIRADEMAADLYADGVEVGRASHRPRNPSNGAFGWLEPVVAAYVDAEASGQESPGAMLVDLPDDRVGYVEPIRVQAPCLTCHGTDVDPAVREEIEAIYPDDRATGFEVGDFRGVIWVTMPSGATG